MASRQGDAGQLEYDALIEERVGDCALPNVAIFGIIMPFEPIFHRQLFYGNPKTSSILHA